MWMALPLDYSLAVEGEKLPEVAGNFPEVIRGESGLSINGVSLAVDVIFPVLHGTYGEDGQLQSDLDHIKIPYVGNSAELMALAADKAKAKAVVSAAGVTVPAGKVLHRGDCLSVSRPSIIKPNHSDNSLGLSLVTTDTDGDAALATAFEYADEVLVEEFIELGREVRCGVIVQAGELVCLPLEEYAVNPETHPIRTYADKLKQNEDGSLDCAAKEKTKAWIVDPRDPVTQRVWALAKQCHVAFYEKVNACFVLLQALRHFQL
jgi:D-alanine-D-alanine ligase